MCVHTSTQACIATSSPDKINQHLWEQLAEAIDFDLKMPYAVMTFHPVTLEQRDSLKDVDEILKAIDFVDDMKFIFT